MSQSKGSAILAAMMPSLILNLLNGFYTYKLFAANQLWFWFVDVAQWVVVPTIVLLILRKISGIAPVDYGLSSVIPGRVGLPSVPLYFGLFPFTIAALWLAYYPIEQISHRLLWPYASEFGYVNTIPHDFFGKLAAATYFSATAAFVEEVVFRGLPWLYLSVAKPSRPVFLYIFVTSLLFAATHWEQGPHGVIASFSFGIVSAMLYSRTENLWPLIVGHFILDWIGFW